MTEKNFTRLTFENGYGRKIAYEFDHNDVKLNDIIDAFHTCLIGATFEPSSIYQSMIEFVEDKTGENYIIDLESNDD